MSHNLNNILNKYLFKPGERKLEGNGIQDQQRIIHASESNSGVPTNLPQMIESMKMEIKREIMSELASVNESSPEAPSQ